MPRHVFIAALCSAALTASAVGQHPTAEDPRRLLRSAGVEPTAAGIVRFLRDLNPTPSPTLDLRVAWLIAQLEDPQYSVRERAEQSLRSLGRSARAGLRRAARTGSLEARTRARSLLDESAADSSRVLAAAIWLARHERFEAAVGPLVRAAPCCGSEAILDLLAATVIDLATLVDHDTLFAALDAPDFETRIVAIRALGAILPDAEVGELVPELAARDLRLRFEVARVLASRGRQECIPTLVALLTSTSTEIRRSSHSLLVDRTGTSLGFDPDADARLRAHGLRRWRVWLRDWQLDAARRDESLPPPSETSIAAFWLSTPDAVLRCTPDDRTTHRIPCRSSSVEPGPNRTVVICDRTGGIVSLHDYTGDLRHRIVGLREPTHARLLRSGNLLVVEATGQLVERGPDGKRRWSADGFDFPLHAQRLTDGNTLIAESGRDRVVEIDERGEIVWESRILESPTGSARLPDGRTVATSASGCVVMISCEGRELWRTKVGGELGPPLVGSAGIYVAAHAARRVALLAEDGELRRIFTLPSSFGAVGYELCR